MTIQCLPLSKYFFRLMTVAEHCQLHIFNLIKKQNKNSIRLDVNVLYVIYKHGVTVEV